MLAADNRIRADVIAVVDSGSISIEDVVNSLNPNNFVRPSDFQNIGNEGTNSNILYFPLEDSTAITQPFTPELFEYYYNTYGEPLVGSAHLPNDNYSVGSLQELTTNM